MSDPLRLIEAQQFGMLTEAEAVELDDWLRRDPSNVRIFAREAFIHQRLRDVLRSTAVTSIPPQSNRLDAARPRVISIRFAAAAAVIILAAALFIVLFTHHAASPDRSRGDDSAPAVATLTNTEHAVFVGGAEPPALGSSLKAGRIQLAAGRLQVMFASTAVVDLIGPCDFQMTGPNRGRLAAGSIHAFVRPAAHGFTVETPDGVSITDLGTEFDVDVSSARGDAVRVQRGSVRIDAPNQPPMTLLAGQALTVRAGRIGPVTHMADYPLLRESFDAPAALQSESPAELAAGDLPALGLRSDPAGQHLHLTTRQSEQISVLRRVRDRVDRDVVINDRGTIGRAGAVIYMAWTTRAESIAKGDIGGLAMIGGKTESLLIGKTDDRSVFSIAYHHKHHADLFADPGASHPSLIPIDHNAHRFVIRVDYLAGNDRVRIWIDPPASAEPTQANADFDDVKVGFDRIHFIVDRSANRADADVAVRSWDFDDLCVGTTWRSVADPDGGSPR